MNLMTMMTMMTMIMMMTKTKGNFIAELAHTWGGNLKDFSCRSSELNWTDWFWTELIVRSIMMMILMMILIMINPLVISDTRAASKVRETATVLMKPFLVKKIQIYAILICFCQKVNIQIYWSSCCCTFCDWFIYNLFLTLEYVCKVHICPEAE